MILRQTKKYLERIYTDWNVNLLKCLFFELLFFVSNFFWILLPSILYLFNLFWETSFRQKKSLYSKLGTRVATFTVIIKIIPIFKSHFTISKTKNKNLKQKSFAFVFVFCLSGYNRTGSWGIFVHDWFLLFFSRKNP